MLNIWPKSQAEGEATELPRKKCVVIQCKKNSFDNFLMTLGGERGVKANCGKLSYGGRGMENQEFCCDILEPQ